MRPGKVVVAGGETLLGRALVERVGAGEPRRADWDAYFKDVRPEKVFVAAGLSGGIGMNQARPADLMVNNLLSTVQILDAAARYGVRKLVYLGSSCSYPRDAAQPLRVEALMTGRLEPTNAAYATAKLAGWQLCRAYRQQLGVNFVTAIPANAFGPGDDFGADSGHVIPALIRRAHEAKVHGQPTLTVWGSGRPRREFIAARDVADACAFVMDHYDGDEPINLGNQTSFTIAEVAETIADVVGYEGRLVFDASKPDGMPLKMLDSTPLYELGWRPATDFRAALTETYHSFLQHEVTEDRQDVPPAVPRALPHPPRRGRDRARLPQR